MKNKKGFTLIELLAVIVILGLLMAIAIPSVTKYITESRKKTVVSTIGNYITAMVNEVNDLTYTFTEANTIYAVPIECIALERGGTNPFGAWHQASNAYWAYVLVQYDDETSSYRYGYTFKDSAGYGLYPTVQSKLNEQGKQIQTGLNLTRPKNGKATNITELPNWSGFDVNTATSLKVLIAESEGNTGDGKSTCTLLQKGNNYVEVEEEKEELKVSSGQCTGTGTNISDIINCGGEEFYVIENNSDSITALAKNNIDITTFKQSPTYSGVAFSATNYWNSYESYPVYVYDENSNIHQYLARYQKYLTNDLGISSAEISLIDVKQLEKLGCTRTGDVGCDGTKEFLTMEGGGYWSGSASAYSFIWYIDSTGNLSYLGWFNSSLGIRPIINVSKSDIDFS